MDNYRITGEELNKLRREFESLQRDLWRDVDHSVKYSTLITVEQTSGELMDGACSNCGSRAEYNMYSGYNHCTNKKCKCIALENGDKMLPTRMPETFKSFKRAAERAKRLGIVEECPF